MPFVKGGKPSIRMKCKKENCNFIHYTEGWCQRHYIQYLRFGIMDILGGQKCIKCGIIDVRCLQLDHKNSGGSKQHKKLGPLAVYRFYFRNPNDAKNDLQVLCANCNFIKSYEKREINHFK